MKGQRVSVPDDKLADYYVLLTVAHLMLMLMLMLLLLLMLMRVTWSLNNVLYNASKTPPNACNLAPLPGLDKFQVIAS